MTYPTDKVQTHVFTMLLVVVGFGLAAVYSVIAFAAQDPLWFQRDFEALPARIVVYHAGQRTEMRSGQPGFAELAEAVRASLAEGVARQSGIGLSPESLQQAYSRYLTLEVFFDQPVKLHAWFNTSQPTQMLFPITGRHSDVAVVFLGHGGTYMINGPVLRTVEPIRQALKSLGYYPPDSSGLDHPPQAQVPFFSLRELQ